MQVPEVFFEKLEIAHSESAGDELKDTVPERQFIHSGNDVNPLRPFTLFSKEAQHFQRGVHSHDDR